MALNVQFTNNATTTLASGITNVATSLTVSTGAGALFPTLAGSQYFYCTLIDAATSTAIEIVKVTARSSDTFTIVRAQEGTTAHAYLAGDKVELRLTAAGIGAIYTETFASVLSTANTFTADQTVPSINGGQLAGFRNLIINGAMALDQRNNGAAITPSDTANRIYTVDRFCARISAASKLTFQQVADAPDGFKYSMKITVASQYSPVSTDYFHFMQAVEGNNLIPVGFGTAAAKTVTASFGVKGSVAGTYCVSLCNAAGNRSYVGTVSVTNSWARVSVTLIADTTGTWATDSTEGMTLRFDLGSGSNLNATAGAWSSGLFTRTSGAVTFVNQTVGSTLNITEVQLEPGPVATPFENRLYGTELSLCQRYFQTYGEQVATFVFAPGQAYASSNAIVSFPLRSVMRVAPTLGLSAASDFLLSTSGFGTTNTCSAITNYVASTVCASLNCTSGANITAGNAVMLLGSNTGNARLTFNSEL